VTLARLKESLESAKVDSDLFRSLKAELTAAAQNSGDKRLKAEIESKLQVRETFSLGMTAPDIEGIDLDGVAFKLSDYQGKVVFVDFWGDW